MRTLASLSKSLSFFLFRTIALLSIFALFYSDRHLSASSALWKLRYPKHLDWDVSLSNITLAPASLYPLD